MLKHNVNDGHLSPVLEEWIGTLRGGCGWRRIGSFRVFSISSRYSSVKYLSESTGCVVSDNFTMTLSPTTLTWWTLCSVYREEADALINTPL